MKNTLIESGIPPRMMSKPVSESRLRTLLRKKWEKKRKKEKK